MPQKKLFLLRHAQAASTSSGDDKVRALTPAGKDDAKALGREMQKQEYIPDLVLCSSALRTKQTLENVNHTLGIENMRYEDILYNGTPGDYLYMLQQTDNTYDTVLMVAHNPCIYELAILLCAKGSDSVMQRLSEGYPPASLSVVECDCTDWKDIQPAENTLSSLINPIDYNAPARPTRWM